MQDQDWLAEAKNDLSLHWEKNNAARKSTIPVARLLPLSRIAALRKAAKPAYSYGLYDLKGGGLVELGSNLAH